MERAEAGGERVEFVVQQDQSVGGGWLTEYWLTPTQDTFGPDGLISPNISQSIPKRQ